MVIGLSTVELVRFGEDPPRVVPLEAPPALPSYDRMPVALVPGDFDRDGELDLWVQEA